jgi:hypothetical protein
VVASAGFRNAELMGVSLMLKNDFAGLGLTSAEESGIGSALRV